MDSSDKRAPSLLSSARRARNRTVIMSPQQVAALRSRGDELHRESEDEITGPPVEPPSSRMSDPVGTASGGAPLVSLRDEDDDAFHLADDIFSALGLELIPEDGSQLEDERPAQGPANVPRTEPLRFDELSEKEEERSAKTSAVQAGSEASASPFLDDIFGDIPTVTPPVRETAPVSSPAGVASVGRIVRVSRSSEGIEEEKVPQQEAIERESDPVLEFSEPALEEALSPLSEQPQSADDTQSNPLLDILGEDYSFPPQNSGDSFDLPIDSSSSWDSSPQEVEISEPSALSITHAVGRVVGFLVSYDRVPEGEFVELRIGRLVVTSEAVDGVAALCVDDPTISPMHATLVIQEGSPLYVLDQMSQSGTRIVRADTREEEALSGSKAALNHGDVVVFGERSFHVCLIPR